MITYNTVLWNAAAAQSLQSCPTLCNPTDSSPPGSPVPGILQARTLEWVTISFSERNYRKKESEVTESSPTLCNPMDFSLPGSSIMDSSRQEYWSGSSFPSPKLVWIFFFLKKKCSFPELYNNVWPLLGIFLRILHNKMQHHCAKHCWKNVVRQWHKHDYLFFFYRY